MLLKICNSKLAWDKCWIACNKTLYAVHYDSNNDNADDNDNGYGISNHYS